MEHYFQQQHILNVHTDPPTSINSKIKSRTARNKINGRVRTYTKWEQTCVIKTDLLLSYFISSLPGFRQFAGRFGDQGSKSSRKARSVSSRCLGISVAGIQNNHTISDCSLSQSLQYCRQSHWIWLRQLYRSCPSFSSR